MALPTVYPWDTSGFGGTGDNLLGTCGGANHGPGACSALGNWSTRISELTPQVRPCFGLRKD